MGFRTLQKLEIGKRIEICFSFIWNWNISNNRQKYIHKIPENACTIRFDIFGNHHLQLIFEKTTSRLLTLPPQSISNNSMDCSKSFQYCWKLNWISIKQTEYWTNDTKLHCLANVFFFSFYFVLIKNSSEP